jgi:hypothetical protein
MAYHTKQEVKLQYHQNDDWLLNNFNRAYFMVNMFRGHRRFALCEIALRCRAKTGMADQNVLLCHRLFKQEKKLL